MPGRRLEDSTGVYLNAVPSFSYADGRDSLVLALRAAASALGREISYPMLKGLSGLAFRLIFHRDWRRYSPDALEGFDHSHLAFACLGFKPLASTIPPGDRLAMQKSRMAIIENVRAGRPVLALRLMDWEDWGVIAGYTRGAEVLLCRTPHDEDPIHLSDNRSWPVMMLEIHPSTTSRLSDRRSLILQSLRTAVEIFEAEQYGPYFSGRSAYLYWITGLRDEKAFACLEERGGRDYSYWINLLRAADAENTRLDARYTSPYLERAHVNAWRLASLIDARKAAVAFLREIAPSFDGSSAGLLTRAADLYAQVETILSAALPDAPWEQELTKTMWTQEMRLCQAAALERALGVEGQAVETLSAFLQSAGSSV